MKEMRVQDLILSPDEMRHVNVQRTVAKQAKTTKSQRRTTPTYEIVPDENSPFVTVIRTTTRTRRELRLDLERKVDAYDMASFLRGAPRGLRMADWLPAYDSNPSKIAEEYNRIRSMPILSRMVREGILTRPLSETAYDDYAWVAVEDMGIADVIVDAAFADDEPMAVLMGTSEVTLPPVTSFQTIASLVRDFGAKKATETLARFLAPDAKLGRYIDRIPYPALLDPERTIAYMSTQPSRHGMSARRFARYWADAYRDIVRSHNEVHGLHERDANVPPLDHDKLYPKDLHHATSVMRMRCTMHELRRHQPDLMTENPFAKRLAGKVGSYVMIPASYHTAMPTIPSSATTDADATLLMAKASADECWPYVERMPHVAAIVTVRDGIVHTTLQDTADRNKPTPHVLRDPMPAIRERAAAIREWAASHRLRYDERFPEDKRQAPDEMATRPSVSFETAMSNGMDGAIRRTDERGSKLLVLLMSQRQFYIKNESTGRIAPVTRHSLKTFLERAERPAGCEKAPLDSPVDWLKGMVATSDWTSGLLTLIGDETFTGLARRGLICLDEREVSLCSTTQPSMALERLQRLSQHADHPAFKSLWGVAETRIERDVLARRAFDAKWSRTDDLPHVKRALMALESDLTYAMADKFGTSAAKELAERWSDAWAHDACKHWQDVTAVTGARRLMQTLGDCDHRSVTNYLMTRTIVEGMRTHDLVNTWTDTLRMQQDVYGRIRERYPKHLQKMHDSLAQAHADILEKIEDERTDAMFKTRAMELEKIAHADDRFLIRPPESLQEMLDEAKEQHNCLASYTQGHATGTTTIMLMRDAHDPERSLVTVEVRDGIVNQAYAACNRAPSAEQRAWLRKWADSHGLTM